VCGNFLYMNMRVDYIAMNEALNNLRCYLFKYGENPKPLAANSTNFRGFTPENSRELAKSVAKIL